MGSIAAGQRIKASDFTWKTWTPTYTNLTVGAGGTVTARYRRLGDSAEFYWQFVYGTGSAVGTSPTFTLPVAPVSYYGTGATTPIPSGVHLLDAGSAARQGVLQITSGSAVTILFYNATPTLAVITATSPWTWGAGDTMTAWGIYQPA